MLRPRPLAAACLAAITLVPSSEGWAADLAAQRLIARAAIDILPHPLAVLLNDRLEEFEERVLEPQTAWPQDRRMRDRRLWNRVALDIAAQQPSPEARLVAARQFPTEKAEALRLYRRLSRRGGNGTLPWAVEQLQHELIEAFRQGNADDLVRQAGYLTHYAAQCCSPFHVSTNFDGKETGNLRLQPVALGHPDYAHRDVSARFFGELVRRNQGRYADRLHLSPGDADPVVEPVQRARSVLLASLAAMDEVAAADAEILLLMQVDEGRALRDRADEYYQLLDRRCGQLCVERLRHGAVFAANLLAGAWQAAGRPALQAGPRDVARAEPEATTNKRPGRDAPSAGPGEKLQLRPDSIVGSARSNIYHYWRCRHAKRIAPENLVVFESVEQAKADGRRACRVCKPPP